MPVNHPPADDPIGPYKRLSHTQSAMLSNCPRQWYHRYKEGLRGESPPILAMGRAVEEAICRTLRESPVLVPIDAQSEWLDSPLEETIPQWAGGALQAVNRPSRSQEGWPSPKATISPKPTWPMSRNEMKRWASYRLDIHFARCWEAAGKEWNEDPNKVGDWDEFTAKDGPRAQQMALDGIELHLDEVQQCIVDLDSEALANWRCGQSRPQWPAPDGFPYQWSTPHPCAKEGGTISWVEAWEIARPWFVDPDADSFSLTCIHKDFWFQGEYDLVYRWTGETHIVDIKASIGATDRSGDYIKQMRTYAWLWWDMHDGQLPARLEIWYLGAASKKYVPVPDQKQMKIIGEELHTCWIEAQEDDAIKEDFPMNPAPYRQFAAGGVSDGEDLSGLTRCTHCDFVNICPNSGPITLPSFEKGFISIGDIDPYLTAWGRVYRLGVELQFPFTADIRKREFTLHMEDGQVNCVLDDDIELPEWEEGMAIRIFGATPAIVKKGTQWWKRLKIGRGASIVLAEERRDGDCLTAQVEAMEVSVKALAFSFDHRNTTRSDGSKSKKWSARLVDDTGVIPVEAWDEKIISMLLDGEPVRGNVVKAVSFSVVGNAAGKPVLRAKQNRSGSSRLKIVD